MRKIAKQFPKRSILGEINNLHNIPKRDVESFFDKKKTIDIFVDNDETARYGKNHVKELK